MRDTDEILPIRLPNHVGDACMALPALRLIAASGPVPVLIGQPWAPSLFAGHRWPTIVLQRRLARDVRDLRSRFKGASRRSLLLPNSFDSALLFRLAGLRAAGLATDARGWLLDVRLPPPTAGHEVRRFFSVALAALRAWQLQPAFVDPPETLGLALDAAHLDQADRLLRQHSISAPFALLAPIATGLHRGRSKQWPHFETLARELTKSGVTPIAVPTAAELGATREAIPSAQLLPPVELGVFAALAQKAAIVVANDSGVSHVAAAVGARQLTLIGVTDPARTGPWSPRAVVAGELDRWPTLTEALSAAQRALQR